jgi:hypothetical protein
MEFVGDQLTVVGAWSRALNLATETADSGAMTTQITHQMFAFAGGGIVAFVVVARLLLRG